MSSDKEGKRMTQSALICTQVMTCWGLGLKACQQRAGVVAKKTPPWIRRGHTQRLGVQPVGLDAERARIVCCAIPDQIVFVGLLSHIIAFDRKGAVDKGNGVM